MSTRYSHVCISLKQLQVGFRDVEKYPLYCFSLNKVEIYVHLTFILTVT